MNRTAKILCLPLLLSAASGFAQPGTPNALPRAETTIIYKHVDENGRVTYANSPIKGGARVDLDPITVIPATPSGSLNSANAQAVPTPAAAPAIAVAKVTPAAKSTAAVASVVPVSAPVQALPAPAAASPAAPANTVIAASADNMAMLTEQRRAETRRRRLEGELQTEMDMLAASQTKLDEERQLSNGIRAMRASFSATPEGVTPQKPLMTPETRAEIERHFERVRNLQDQVAMHETQVQTLRDQLNAIK